MLKLNKYKSFEWDKGNIDKSYKKHGITPKEAEEAFVDEKAIILKDIKHSKKEKRYLLLGRSVENKILLVAFTLRDARIRIISARIANKKEKGRYVKKI